MEKLSNLQERYDEHQDFHDLIDSKYTLPVEIQEKSLIVHMTDGGDDDVEYSYTLSASEGHQIDKFFALVGTNKHVTWEDLNIDSEGASIADHHRRDHENFTRFILTLELDELVSPDDSYTVSYSLEHDVVTVEDDYAYFVTRHKTGQASFELVFPKGWSPNRAIARPDNASESKDLPQPDSDRDDEQWRITWECTSCVLGERYELDWRAEQTEATS